MCFLNIHNWYNGSYITGYKSQFTGDHVGRSEVRCMDCKERRIFLSQYSKEHQATLESMGKVTKVGPNKHRYVTYTPGDEIDLLTKKWIADSGAIKI